MIVEFIYFFNNKILIKDMISISILSVSSLLELFQINTSDYLNYAFSTFNLFEIVFIILLIYKMKLAYSLNFKIALKVVTISYIIPLIIWLIIITINSI
jgi:hypothetical protein